MTDVSRYGYAFDPDGDSWAARLLSKVPAGARVLELGPGPGAMTQVLCARGHEVCAVESDPEAITILKNLGISVIDADLNLDVWDQDIGDARFDAILACDVLEHLLFPERVLEKLRAFLNPGGVLIISVPNIAYAGVVAGLRFGSFAYASKGLLDATHLKFFTKTSLSRALLENGWLPISWQSNNVAVERSEFSGYWDMLDIFDKKSIIENSIDYDAYQWMVVAGAAKDSADWDMRAMRLKMEGLHSQLHALTEVHAEERASLKEHQKAFSEALSLIDGYKKEMEGLKAREAVLNVDLSNLRATLLASGWRGILRRIFFSIKG